MIFMVGPPCLISFSMNNSAITLSKILHRWLITLLYAMYTKEWGVCFKSIHLEVAFWQRNPHKCETLSRNNKLYRLFSSPTKT